MTAELDLPGRPVATDEAPTVRVGVRALVEAFGQLEATVRGAFAALAAAEDAANAVFALGDRRTLSIECGRYSHGANFRDVDDAVARLRRTAWECVIDRLEIRRVMSDSASKELDRRLQDEEPLPITEQNVAAFARRYAGDLPGTFKQKAVEVFDWLRPRDGSQRAEYRTNQRHARLEIGERVILTGMVETWSFRGAPFRVRYHSA